jgi:iron complex outermembrane recepter protein
LTSNVAMRGSAAVPIAFVTALLAAPLAANERRTPDVSAKVRIPPQSLESALLLYAAQCDVQLIVSAPSIAGARSRGAQVDGCERVPQALLEGTRFEHRLVGANTVAIVESKSPVRTAATQSFAVDRVDPLQPETMTVTGSRIRGTSLDRALPIVSVRGEDIAAVGQINLADALIELPSVEPGFSPRNSQAQTSGGAGLNLLNLRGMGVERSLVLVDGRRQVGARRGLSSVDINTIPAAFVERIDVVTGGNSAIYGADAVTGVLNIVLKDRYEGIGGDVAGGMTSHGDGSWHSLQMFGGHAFEAAPVRVMGSFVSDRVTGVEASARDYANNGLDLVANESGAPLYVHRERVRISHFAPQGSFDIGSRRYVFDPDGSGMRPFDFGASGDLSGSHIDGDGPSLDDFVTLRMPTQRHAAFARLDYDFAASRLALQARAAETKVTAFWQPLADPVTIGRIHLQRDNPFLPAAVVEAMQDAGLDAIEVSRLHEEFGRVGTHNQRRLLQLAAQLDGELASEWRYELFATYGRNRDATRSLNLRDTGRFLESLDAVRDPQSAAIVCRDAVARARGCMPLNIVGSDRMSDAAIDYSRIHLQARETLTETVTGGHVAGLIDAAGVPLESVFGWEYREESSERRSSVPQTQGLVSLPRVPSDRGRYDVIETYSEASARVLGDTRLSKALDLGGAARLSHYSTVGTELAWQGSIDYAITDDARVRIVRSRATRAPNIRELYSTGEEGFTSVMDPCDAVLRGRTTQRASNCDALGLPADFDGENRILRRVLYTGNSQLRAEIADTLTFGFVLTPRWLPQWRFSADYWRIDIDDAIETFDEQAIVNRCVDTDLTVATNPYCLLTLRDDTGLIREIRAMEQNGGRLSAEGIDIDLSFGQGGARSTRGAWFQLLATTLLDFSVPEPPPFDAAPRSRAGVLPHLRFQASLLAGYRFDALALGWKTTYLSSGWIAQDAGDFLDRPRTGARAFHDLFASYDVEDSIRVRLGVSNVFDDAPPQRALGINQGQGGGAIYPNLGRQLFGAIDFNF